MAQDVDILQRAAELSRRGESFVLITVTGAEGSTPRNVGAKMIWTPDAPLNGTVGGGQFEFLALDSARRHYEQRTSGAEEFVLGAEAEQCCGGRVQVFYEFIGSRNRLVIFGAGHVSHALVGVLRAASLDIVVVDDRPEWNSESRFGTCRRIGGFDEGVDAALERPEATLACVMTCSHDTDLSIVRALLTAPAGAPAFVGLIGSRSKRACFFGRLASSGVDESLIARVHCPIGLGDMGKEPELVAVSIAGQVLLEAKKLAAL